MSNVVVYDGAKKWKVSLLGSAAVFFVWGRGVSLSLHMTIVGCHVDRPTDNYSLKLYV